MRIFGALAILGLVLLASPSLAQQTVVETQPLPRLSTDASSTITVTNTFQTVWGQQNGPQASPVRAACSIQNNGGNNMWVYAGAGTPAKAMSLVVAPGAVYSCGSNEVVGTSLIAITGTSGDAFTAILDGAPTVGGPPQATSGGGSDVTIVGPLGQAVMAASLPVAIASNQSVVPTSNSTQLPAALGQTVMAASLPVTLASNQSAVPTSNSTQLPAALGQTTKSASLPVTLASDQGGVVVSTSDPCTSAAKSSAAISVTSGTTTSLVGVSGSTVVYVCGFAITIAPSAVTAATALFEYGTGAACTSPTVLTGTFGNGDLTSAAGVAPILYGGGSQTVFKGAASSGICILTAGNAVSVQGVITYVQQ